MEVHYWLDTALIFGLFALFLIDVVVSVRRLNRVDELLKRCENVDCDMLDDVIDVLHDHKDIGIELANESGVEQLPEDCPAAH